MTSSWTRRSFGKALCLGGAAASAASPGRYPVREFGARGDGAALDTKAIQAAIDACGAAGGGGVYVAPGRYLSGTLVLRSNVTLLLEAGAVLLGSKNLDDYPSMAGKVPTYTETYVHQSLLYGEDLENVALEGRGVIDGQGAAFPGSYRTRPYLVRMINCRNVSVTGVTMKDSPMWVQHYLACENVQIRGITVHSRCNRNNDGIDIDACDKVRISDSEISSDDDAIVLKSTAQRPCRDVTITNCVLSSRCNALKLGTESNGGFENIVISNCAVYDTRLSGIALEIVDGGTLDRVSVSGLTLRDARSAIFMRLGNRARPVREGMAAAGAGSFRRVMLRDIVATGASRIGCAIAGIPGHFIEDVTLDNVRILFEGGGTAQEAAREAPEEEARYPEHSMFGVLPAYGFFCRHVRGLRLSNVQVAFDKPDLRPALVADDVEDLELSGFRPMVVPGAGPVVRLRQARRVLIAGNQAPPGTGEYLRVEGDLSAGIQLLANDLSAAQTPVRMGDDVKADAVRR